MAVQEEEEESEEPSWVDKLKSEGPVELVDPDEEGVMGWSSPPGDCFQVRGKDYLTTKVKIPAGDCLLRPVAIDWMRSNSRIDEFLRSPDNRVMRAVKEAASNGDVAEDCKPFIWAINLQVPSKDHHSLIMYYMSTTPSPEGSLQDRFLKGDDEFRNSRLKLIANIVKGPWIVKTAVGDHAICILGKSLTCRYARGDNFLEMDVDIGSSMVASAIVHLAINYVTSITVDLAFVIEGRSEDELPERLLGTVRFAQLELGAAIPLGAIPSSTVPEELPSTDVDEFEDALDEEIGDSFSTRLWKSIGQGFNGDWWQKQQM